MKVLHITDYIPDCHRKWGGAEQICWRLLFLLNKQGWDINVVSTKPPRRPEEDYNFCFINTSENLLPDKLRGIYRGIKSILPLDPLAFILLYRLMRQSCPDIVHLHNIKNLTLAIIWAARIFKRPIIVSIYDYWYFCPQEILLDRKGRSCTQFAGGDCAPCLNMPLCFRPLFRLRRRFFDFFLKKVAVFVVLSKSSQKILQDYGIGREKIKIVYQPAPFKAVHQADELLKLERPFLLLVGNLNFNKGAHIAIEALALIKRQLPEVRLYIVGARPEFADKRYAQRLNLLLERHRLKEAVFFLDRQSPGKMLAIFRRADVVIIPEQWENMSPVVLAEAMFLAKPIVASRIGGIPEFIRDRENGLLARHEDAVEFARQAIWILQNPEGAKRLAENARIAAGKIWNDERNLKDLIRLYESLITPHPNPLPRGEKVKNI